jgi:ribonuclease HII
MEKLKSPQKPLKLKKIVASFDLEKQFHQRGLVVGIDEVGRGCIAGPVLAAAVAFRREDWDVLSPEMVAIKDSKKLTPEKRQELARWIRSQSVVCETVALASGEVDRLNILQATLRAFALLMKQIASQSLVDVFLIDGNQTIRGQPWPQHAVVKGDQRSKSIAAASIVAKVARDQQMEDLARLHPQYGFESHKGYGTSAHYEALQKYGLLPEHRRSFLKNFNARTLGQNGEQLVAQYLEGLGFEVVSRNLRAIRGELDLLARKGGDFHFVEVRTRSDGDRDLAFPQSKQIQFKKAAQAIALDYGIPASRMRYDFAFVSDQKVEMLWDVFQW